MKIKIGIIGLILIFNLFLISCYTDTTSSIPANKLCSVDSDCVPDACCHPKDAVNLNNAPDCKGMMCTFNCEPETLDCGQGEIKCVNQECTAILK